MKVYKNFDEISGKILKTTKKILRKLKKNWSVLNIADITKKVTIFEKI